MAVSHARLAGLVRVATAAALLFASCAAPPSGLEAVERALADGRDHEAYELAEAHAATAGVASSEAWIVLARSASRVWRSGRAQEAAERATELAPDSAPAHHVLSRVHRQRAQLADAIDAARTAARLAPEEARYHASLGEALLGRKNVFTPDYPAAEAAFREAFARDPSNSRIRFGLARVLVESGRHAEGEAHLDTVITACPYDGPAHSLRGLARLRTRDYEGAAEDLMRATALDPQSPETLFALARTFHLLDRRDDAETARGRYRWMSSLAGGIDGLELRYHTDPENPRASQDLVQAFLTARRFRDARRIALNLASDHPKLPNAFLALGEAALGVDDVKTAVDAAARAVELRPRDADGQNLASRAYAATGDRDAALRAARTAVELDGTNPEHVLQLAERLLDTGEADEAARRFEEVLRVDPSRMAAAAGLGRARAALGQPEEAERHLTRALQGRPRRGPWLLERGRVRRKLGRLLDAEADFRRARDVAPENPDPYGELAALLREAGKRIDAETMEREYRERVRVSTAVREAEEAVAKAPRSQEAVTRLAALLRESGREMDALLLEERVFVFEAEW